MPSNSFTTRLLLIIRKRRFLLVYFPLAVYWIAMTFSITISADILFRYNFNDKVQHAISFFILTGMLSVACRVQEKIKAFSSSPFIWAFLISSLYGTLSEIIQFFMPLRYCDVYDLAANFAGSAAAAAAGYFLLASPFREIYK